MRPRGAFDVSLTAVIALFAAACWFAHPTADDFIYAANARVGWWDAWLREYAAWNGRYTSNALVLATPLRFGISAYRAAAATTLAATLVAAFVAIGAWVGPAISRRDVVTCGLAICALYLSQTPSVGEAIYWYTSAATYQLWIVPAALYVWLMCRHVGGRHRPAALAVAALLLLIVAGFNEVTMLIFIAVHALWIGFALRERPGGRSVAISMLAVLVAGGLIVWLSPGNAVRQSMYAGVRHNVVRSVAWSALQTLRFGAEFVANGPLLLATALVVPLAHRWAAHENDVRVGRRLLAVTIGLAILIPIATFPAYWETGTLGQHRTVNVAYAAFLGLWFVGVSAWAAAGSRAAEATRAFAESARRPLAVAFLVGVALTGNSYGVGSDLVSGRLAQYDREMTARYAQLHACRDHAASPCAVAPLEVKPASFTVVDLSANPSDWVNAAYARYFNLSEVQLRR